MEIDIRKKLSGLIDIGIAISSERSLEKLLDQILYEARVLASADAGSLYVREDNKLRFVAAQNDTLNQRMIDKKVLSPSMEGVLLPISNDSIAGYVASTGSCLNIDDAYEIDSSTGLHLDKSFDQKNNYRTQSMLMIPLTDPQKDIIGVLQLINAQDDDGKIIPFEQAIEDLCVAMGSQAAVSIKNAQLTEDLKQAHLGTIFRLCMAAEYRDEDTFKHIKRISLFCEVVARELKMSDEFVEMILYSSPMHDVGKLGIPDSILLKPGKLTPEEFDIIKTHTTIGGEILKNPDTDILKMSYSVALTHHEKWNGSGYPNGLKGEDIPIEGRIVAVADVFDALANKRVYKPAMPVDKCLDILKKDSGTHFDPNIVKVFIDNIDEILHIKKQFADEEL